MNKKTLISRALLAAALFSVVTLAQEPAVNIDAKIHPNLAEAQRLLVEANNKVNEAQKDNRYDMKGHAEKARQFMAQASNELKLAAEAANAGRKH
jgi:hypothetical protein